MGVYSNMAAAVVRESNVPSSASQFLIDTEKDRFAMFEAVLECDFANAYNGAGLAVLTEAEKKEIDTTAGKSILQKIIDAIKKFFAWIGQCIKKIVDGVSNLAHNDLKLYEKYKGKINKSNIAKCELKGDVPTMDGMTSYMEKMANSTGLEDTLNQIDSATSAGADKIVEKYKKDTDERLKKFLEVKYMNKDVLINTVDIATMTEAMQTGYKTAVSQLTSMLNGEKASLNQTLHEVEVERADATKKVDTARANAKYQVVSYAISSHTKASNFSISAMKSMIAAYRRIWAQLGAFVTKNNLTKVKEAFEEEAFVIEMCSDNYVETVLE